MLFRSPPNKTSLLGRRNTLFVTNVERGRLHQGTAKVSRLARWSHAQRLVRIRTRPSPTKMPAPGRLVKIRNRCFTRSGVTRTTRGLGGSNAGSRLSGDDARREVRCWIAIAPTLRNRLRWVTFFGLSWDLGEVDVAEIWPEWARSARA